MEISFYLKDANSLSETPIYARICYDGLKLKYYPSEKIRPKFWSKNSQRAKQSASFREYPEFNRRLEIIEADIKKVYRTYLNEHKNQVPSTEVFKALLDKELKKRHAQKEKVNTLFGFFEDFIEKTERGARLQPKTGKPYSKATIQVYKNTLNRLMAFQATRKRAVDFDSIDLDFYSDFTEYLTNREKLSSNTIGKDIKTLKTVLNDATERGVNKNLQFKSKRFSTTSEQTESIFLTEDEIKEIERLDLADNSRLEYVRDLFLIGCYTGLRYSDFSSITSENIGENITIRQVKTGGEVVIPIHKTVKRILEKYSGNLPPSISNQKTNEYLKGIGAMIPTLKSSFSRTMTKGGVRVTHRFKRWELLTTHTARRSFATNQYLKGVPTITIMAITGHKTEKAFMRYIKLTPDDHARVLKAKWDEGAKLMAV